MTNERIDSMMDKAARFYYRCPIPGLRVLPVMICAAIAAKAIRQRRLERLKLEQAVARNREIA